MAARAVLGAVLLATLACSGGKATGGAAAPITDREWNLVAIGSKTDPVGAGGKPVTLKLDAEAKHADGFGGCNRYGGPIELDGEKLSFGPIASTRMACEQGMDVEDAFLPALGSTQTWELVGAELVLKAAGVPVLRFRAAAP